MRLRQSNKGKRFGPSDFALSLDLSDDGQAALARQANESSEEEYVVNEPGVDEGDDDDILADFNDSEDDDDGGDFEEALSHVGSPVRKQPGPGGKPMKRAPPPPPDNNLGEVPPYPSDPGQRWTRTYLGPVKRWTRIHEMVTYWFSDRANYRTVFNGFLRLWWDQPILPPKLTSNPALLKVQAGWMPADFVENQEAAFGQWYHNVLVAHGRRQKSILIDRARAFRWFLPQAEGDWTIRLGHVSSQKDYQIRQGESISFSDAGVPIDKTDSDDIKTGGWLLDVGGVIVSMGWAPARGQSHQLLALAVVPFSDSAYYEDLRDEPTESEKKEGTVQIWKFEADKDPRGILRPARRSPQLVHAICFSWGRVTRMQWCPVTLAVDDQLGLLGVLCNDGILRVLGVQRASEESSKGIFEEVQEPMVTIEPPKEYTVQITSFTWINTNRIAAGLSDGSIGVWSISPCRFLQRHPVHSSAVMDIVSGYPSDPFIVGTIPVGGLLTVTDLSRPNAEMTYHPNMLISLQPNLLAWSHHVRGFAAIWPSAFPGNPNVTFLPARVFPLSRHICTLTGQPTCIAFGSCHPYVLIGSNDGSVTVFNVLRKLSADRKPVYKLKLFQHEYRPPTQQSSGAYEDDQETLRGASRILHGFLPEPNTHPGNTLVNNSKSKNKKDKQGKGKGRASKSSKQAEEAVIDLDEMMEQGVGRSRAMAGPITIHDPLTRITSLSWNPNVEYSWWAAAAMGSGLIRVMDLGFERDGDPVENETPEPSVVGDGFMMDEDDDIMEVDGEMG